MAAGNVLTIDYSPQSNFLCKLQENGCVVKSSCHPHKQNFTAFRQVAPTEKIVTDKTFCKSCDRLQQLPKFTPLAKESVTHSVKNVVINLKKTDLRAQMVQGLNYNLNHGKATFNCLPSDIQMVKNFRLVNWRDCLGNPRHFSVSDSYQVSMPMCNNVSKSSHLCKKCGLPKRSLTKQLTKDMRNPLVCIEKSRQLAVSDAQENVKPLLASKVSALASVPKSLGMPVPMPSKKKRPTPNVTAIRKENVIRHTVDFCNHCQKQ